MLHTFRHASGDWDLQLTQLLANVAHSCRGLRPDCVPATKAGSHNRPPWGNNVARWALATTWKDVVSRAVARALG
jgi:hypothetical protein